MLIIGRHPVVICILKMKLLTNWNHLMYLVCENFCGRKRLHICVIWPRFQTIFFSAIWEKIASLEHLKEAKFYSLYKNLIFKMGFKLHAFSFEFHLGGPLFLQIKIECIHSRYALQSYLHGHLC